MPTVKYPTVLSDEDKQLLKEVVKNGKSSAKTIRRANILLALNEKKTIAEVAQFYHVDMTTVKKVKKQFFEQGVASTIYRKKREKPSVPPKIDGELEAKVIALACSQPPEGYTRWTVRLLANKVVELEFVDSLSHMSVSRILKKMNSNRT